MQANLINNENKNYMKYHLLNMIPSFVHYLDSIETIMSMFEYVNEETETFIFSFLLNESQCKFKQIESI